MNCPMCLTDRVEFLGTHGDRDVHRCQMCGDTFHVHHDPREDARLVWEEGFDAGSGIDTDQTCPYQEPDHRRHWFDGFRAGEARWYKYDDEGPY